MKTKTGIIVIVVAVAGGLAVWLAAGAGRWSASPAPLDPYDRPVTAVPTGMPVTGTGTTEAPPPREETILLRVRSSADDAAIAGAEVLVTTADEQVRAVGETDRNGELHLPPPPGDTAVKLTARREGFVTNSLWLRPDAREVAIRLDPGVAVRGRVVDAETGAPIAGAVVHVRDEESLDELDEPIVTDAEGRFVVAGVHQGFPFSLEVVKDGLGPVWVVDRRESAGSEIVVRMGAGAVITGKVTTPAGTPAAGAEVLLLLEGNDPRQGFLHSKRCEIPSASGLPRTIAGEDGWYEVRGLPTPSTWLMAARAGTRGWSDATRVFLTEAGAKERRDYSLRPCPVIRVRLEDPAGEPVSEAEVGARGRGDPSGLGTPLGRSAARKPESDGTWLLLPEAAGPFVIQVRAPGFVPVERKVAVEPGDEAELAITLSRGVALEGRVVDAEGSPVGGAAVSIWIPDGTDVLSQSAGARSAADGSFRIAGLQAARGRLSASLPDAAPTRRDDVLPGGDPVTIEVSEPTTIRGRFSPNPGVDAMTVSYCGERGGGSKGPGPVEPNGSFTLHPSPWMIGSAEKPKKFTLSLGPEGWPPVAIRELQLRHGEDFDLGEVPLDPGVTLEGRVTARDGAPVAGARVSLYQKGMLDAVVRYSDADGAFRFPRVPPGPATLSVESRGLLLPEVRKLQETKTAGRVDITLAPAGAVLITVVGPEGMPVSGLTPVLAPVDREGPVHCGLWETDSGGRMRIVAPAGRFRVRYHDGEKMADGPEVEVIAGKQTDVRLAVPMKGPVGEVFTNLPR